MYSAVPWATRRTFAYVKSSAITPRQPSVPNLIWSVIGLKVTGLAGPPQGLDDLANVLRSGPGNHQQGVFRVDDDHVLEADRGHQAVVTQDQAPSGVDEP